MKYRVIEDDDEEITIITEDGGIACIRYADELDEGDGRKAVTDYYQMRFTEEMLDRDNLWEELGEGKMYCEDWTTEFTDPAHIQDALNWLSVRDTFELDETIWQNFGGQ